MPPSLLRLPCLALLLLAAPGCGGDAEPPEVVPTANPFVATGRPVAETRADSVALALYDSLGGPEAWASVRYLRFHFGGERAGTPEVWRRHLWDRATGDYRLEWNQGPDSSLVALFNVNTRQGNVYLNGAPVDSLRREGLLADAYRGFINDTYWLLAPTKLFDPGVNRAYVADSSGGAHDVLLLTFGDVGLTPGDRYWLYVNRETGLLDRWAFVLEGDPDAAPRVNAWEGYETLEVPGGTVRLATRKPRPGEPFAILTDAVEMPREAPPGAFTDPEAMLGKREGENG